MGNQMVLGFWFQLMDGSILGVGRMVKYGTERNTTNTETSFTGGWMEKESIITSMLSSDNIVEVDY